MCPVTKFAGEAAVRSPTEQSACCCADGGAPTQKHEKRGFPEPRARVLGSALLDQACGEWNSSVSRWGPLERWKDNSHSPPSFCRRTSCGVKPFVSGDMARLGRKDMSGKLQNLLMFLRTWKDLYNTFRFDGFSHVRSGQPSFLLTCSNNESLMRGIPLFPRLLMSPVSSCRVGMRCGPFHHPSLAYGEPLTRWLSGTRVSGSTSTWAVDGVFLKKKIYYYCCQSMQRRLNAQQLHL